MLSDLRHGFRALRRSPGFTAAAVLALALGTGANTLVYSVVDGVLLRPLPYAASERVYVVTARGPQGGAEPGQLSVPDLADVRRGVGAFEAVGGIGFGSFDLTGTDRPVQLRAGLVTEGAFDAMRVPPLVGRVPSREETAAGSPVAVLDESIWRSSFAADPAVVGRTISLSGRPFTVVGVLPHLRFRDGQEYEMWAPAPPKEIAEARRDQRGVTVLARLRPGASEDAAREALAVVAARLAAQYPKENGGWTLGLESVRRWEDGALRPALLVLLGAVALVLLIACTNVAHMLLARAAGRQREVAIRAALGASRRRLVRQLLGESLVLAVTGGAAGAALAYLFLPALVRVAPLADTQRAAVALDARVLGVSLAVALATGVLFGLWPALAASRAELHATLGAAGGRGGTGRGGWRARGALVASEIALAAVLLVGAGLLLRSFDGLLKVDRGYDPTLVAGTGIVLPDNVYPNAAAKREFMRRVLERLRATPGVEVAAAANFLPRFGTPPGEVEVPGRTDGLPASARQATWRVATPDYLAALRIPVRRGRGLSDADAAGGARVALVNETFARRYFPGVDPVGREVRLAAFGPPRTLRVVGVVGDVRNGGRTSAVEPDLILPYAQDSWGYMNIVARGRSTTPEALVAAIREAVRAVDPARPTFSAGPLSFLAESDVAQPRFGATLMSLFAGVAAALACVGVFGVMAYAVAQRTREIGIRVALGGAPRQVLGQVLRPGLAVVLLGAGAGVAAGVAFGRVLASQLYGVSPTDPRVLAAVAALVTVVGAVACYVPARRALRVDPVTALRSE